VLPGLASHACLQEMPRLHHSKFDPLMTGPGQSHALPRRSIAVRFTPINRPFFKLIDSPG
jgi:hypothetical protein